MFFSVVHGALLCVHVFSSRLSCSWPDKWLLRKKEQKMLPCSSRKTVSQFQFLMETMKATSFSCQELRLEKRREESEAERDERREKMFQKCSSAVDANEQPFPGLSLPLFSFFILSTVSTRVYERKRRSK